jgi:hypothetical protein
MQLQVWREEGVEGLKHKPPGGATPRLSKSAPDCASFWREEPRRTAFEEKRGRARGWRR